MPYSADPSRYDDMAYRRVGRSGLKLPAVSLGIWQNFGSVTQVSRMHFPCLVTVDKDICVPRLPSYRLLKETAEKPVRKVSFEDLPRKDLSRYGAIGSPTRVERIFAPEAMVSNLYVKGNPQQKAQELVSMLAERKYI